MNYALLALLALILACYALLSERIARAWVTGPMLFLALGVLLGPHLLDLLPLDVDLQLLRGIAELSLAVVLFSDAASADLRALRREFGTPLRLLLLALPGVVLMGVLAGWWLLPGLPFWSLLVLATLLAPTDAALGQAVISNTQVPEPVRASLNAESGLNDGLAVPLFLLFTELALEPDNSLSFGHVLGVFAKELGIGLVTGVLLSGAVAWLLGRAVARGWVAPPWRWVPVIGLAVGGYSLAQWLGGSGFIAAFTGGLVFGAMTLHHEDRVLEDAEGVGQVLALLTWLLFGAAFVLPSFTGLSWQVVAYSLLGLTVVRMLPVQLALLGSPEPPPCRWFIGWFGPRGLATVVFAVMVAESAIDGAGLVLQVAAVTVVLSVLLHGASAAPLAARLAAGKNQPAG